MAEFTYEDIYELLRAEKYSADLQPISTEQLQSIKQYLESKKGLLQKQKVSGLFDKSAREKLRSELENARRALREFYEKREKKVISRAVFTARSDFKVRDTTNFLKYEEEIYLKLLDILKESYSKFAMNFRANGIVKEKIAEPALDAPAQEQPAAAGPPLVANAIAASQEAAPALPQETQPSLKEISILQSVPQLIGTDLKPYGPFKEADVVKVPEEIAGLLIAQGKAKNMETLAPAA